jgi:hypothetical protein
MHSRQAVRTRRGPWLYTARRGTTSDIECRCLDVSATFNQFVSTSKLIRFKKVREFLESAERSLIRSNARPDEYDTCTGCKRGRGRQSNRYVRCSIARVARLVTFSNCSGIVPDGRQRAFGAPYDCVSYKIRRGHETKPLGNVIGRAVKTVSNSNLPRTVVMESVAGNDIRHRVSTFGRVGDVQSVRLRFEAGSIRKSA